MSINSILAGAGAFANRKPIPKKVQLPTPDGELEAQLYFLDLPAAEVRDLLNREGRERDAEFIVKTLCNEDGSPALELEGDHGAMSLKLGTMAVLVAAGLEALGLTKAESKAAKKS